KIFSDPRDRFPVEHILWEALVRGALGKGFLRAALGLAATFPEHGHLRIGQTIGDTMLRAAAAEPRLPGSILAVGPQQPERNARAAPPGSAGVGLAGLERELRFPGDPGLVEAVLNHAVLERGLALNEHDALDRVHGVQVDRAAELELGDEQGDGLLGPELAFVELTGHVDLPGESQVLLALG